MKTYRVKWEIDIEAENEQQAARKALGFQRDRYSTATVFDVTEHEQAGAPSPKTIQIDFMTGTQREI